MIETITNFHETHQAALGIFAAASVIMFIASVLSLPYLVSLIPTDYFQYAEAYRRYHDFKHPLLRLLILLAKNIAGWTLIVLGIILLLLPGQGLITMALGLLLIDFPGKRTVECKLVSNDKILSAINWLRAKRGKEPLLAPQR